MATPPPDTSSRVVARATGTGRFQAAVATRGGTLILDEPQSVGGDATGPTPYELLSAALAACTVMTLKLYAERKGLTLPPLSVEAAHSVVPAESDGGRPRDRFERRIVFDSPPPEELREKLIEIAEKCPVHRTLMRGFEIVTSAGLPGSHPEGEAPEIHEAEMEAACCD
jgi:putative redox protein